MDYAQKLRQQAEALLSIAEQLEREAQREKQPGTEPKLSPVLQPARELPALTRDKPAKTNVTEVAKLKSSQILLSRSKYQTCHIRLSDSEELFPAVVVDRDYYSLAKVFSDIKQVLAVKAKLEWNGDRTVITQIATGYALWVWEPDAQRDFVAEEDAADPNGDPVVDREQFYAVTVSDSQNRSQVSLTEYLLLFNRLSEWVNRYLGDAVVVHYWKSTRPELAWLEQFEVVGSGQIICRNTKQLSLNVWQEKQLQFWLQRFSQRCRGVIPQFPQAFLSEYESNQFLVNLLDEHPKKQD